MRRPRWCAALFLASLPLALSCTDPTSPRADLAKAAGTAVTVTDLDPDAAPRDITLDVQIFGSGYDRGSTAAFAMDGVVDPRVRVNRTTYVSGSQLTANVTIAADAVPDRYDVMVTTATGKKGIGTERFEVLVEVVDLGPIGTGTPWGMSSTGVVVGGRRFAQDPAITPFVWQPGMTGLSPMQSEASWQYSWGQDVNATGDAVGVAQTATQDRAVLWRSATGWSYELLPLPAGLANANADAWDINDAGTIVGNITDATVIASGPAVWRAGVPSLLGRPPGYDARANGQARGINDLGWILGQATMGGYMRAYLWIPSAPGSATGTYLILPLSSLGPVTVGSGISDVDPVNGSVYVSGGGGDTKSPALRWTVKVPAGRAPTAADVTVQVLEGMGASWAVDRTGAVGGYAKSGRGATPSAALWKPSRVDLPPALSSILESAVYDVQIVGDQRWMVGVIEKQPGVYNATLWKMRP